MKRGNNSTPRLKPAITLGSDVQKWVFARHQTNPKGIISRSEVVGEHVYPRPSIIRVLGIAQIEPLSRKMPVNQLAYKLLEAASERSENLEFIIGSLTVEKYADNDFTIEALPTRLTASELIVEREAIFDKLEIEMGKGSMRAPSVPLVKATVEAEIDLNYELLTKRFELGELRSIGYGPITLEDHIPGRASRV